MKVSKLMIILFFLGIVCCSIHGSQADEQQIKNALEIHDRVLTVDTHVDTPYRLLNPEYDISKSHDPRQRGGKVDLPRMKKGGLDAIFFAVFVGQGDRNTGGNRKAKERALKLFTAIHDMLKKHSGLAKLALTADDAYKIEKKGERAIFIGIENGYPVGNDLSLIEKYHRLGARYITLCHTRNNDICDSSTDRKGPEHQGLSDFGEKVVKEMNRVGMMIDVSHVSDDTFYDVLKVSRTPVIASHSCARAICDNPRNLDDKMLKKLAEKGGVIQMCILSSYVKKPDANPQRDAAIKALREKYKNFNSLSEKEQQAARREWHSIFEKYPQKLASVPDVVDHIDHIVKIAGINHVGIGTDFDGGGGVDGCFDVSEMGNITIELVKRGYSEEQIRKIWGGNIMRVLREVEKIAAKGN